ncbi:MAG: hypothetical protein KY462_12805 [Actinobacteria bacterium]|nr:hypothetical protein [Actinomycetota bacterium]
MPRLNNSDVRDLSKQSPDVPRSPSTGTRRNRVIDREGFYRRLGQRNGPHALRDFRAAESYWSGR